jgi:hypothetical protein
MGAPDAEMILSLIWEGITIEVCYQPYWLSEASGYDVAHLDILSVAPAKAPLPFTETGYRSRFLTRGEVADAGGPDAFVRGWLDEAAQSAEWKEQVARSRQMTLF